MFGRLIGGLESQLAGMGTAFASSLLGLAGSLVVGLLELFAGHGQNRFYREMEDWLSSITRVGLVGDCGEETIDQYSLAAVLDHMNYQMESLGDMFVRRPRPGALAADSKMAVLAEAVSSMAHRMEAGGVNEALNRVAEGQEHIVDGAARLHRRHRRASTPRAGCACAPSTCSSSRCSRRCSRDAQAAVDELRGDLSALTRDAAAAQPPRAAATGRRRETAEMAFARRSGQRFTANVWPGFVDAMTALLLVLMFVLSIFMIVQFILSERSRAGHRARRAGPAGRRRCRAPWVSNRSAPPASRTRWRRWRGRAGHAQAGA